MSHVAPIIPEAAPFSMVQRAWLNGWMAAYYGEVGPAAASVAAAGAVSVAAEDEDLPWHDMTLPLDERMNLADGKPFPQRLMAAMAQQDCGQCGYLCKTYAEAIAS